MSAPSQAKDAREVILLASALIVGGLFGACGTALAFAPMYVGSEIAAGGLFVFGLMVATSPLTLAARYINKVRRGKTL